MAIFREPWVIGIIILVVIILFAGPKLPGIARNLGQSMRIIKSEVKEMKNDGKDTNAAASPAPTASAAPTASPAPEVPVEGKIVNNPTVPGDGTGTGAQS